jgi:hypothetical protein
LAALTCRAAAAAAAAAEEQAFTSQAIKQCVGLVTAPCSRCYKFEQDRHWAVHVHV